MLDLARRVEDDEFIAIYTHCRTLSVCKLVFSRKTFIDS